MSAPQGPAPSPESGASGVTKALEQALRTLEREQEALTTELAAARMARAQAESLLSVLAEWSLFIDGAAHDRMRLLREAPRLLVPRLAEAATIEIASFGARPWAVAHVDAARAAALESGEARPRPEGGAGVLRMPLMYGDRALGWLTVWWERPQPVSPAVTMVLGLLSQQMAAVLAEAERQTRRIEAERAGTALTVAIAQELTNPLQALALSLEMVFNAHARGDTTEDWLEQRLAAMRRSTLRMQRGVEMLLAADAVREDRVRLSPERFDLAEVTRRVASAVTLEMEGAGAACVVVDGPAVEGRWDRTSVTLVLGILLRQASRAATGTQVDVRVHADRCARVTVADRGASSNGDGLGDGRGHGSHGSDGVDGPGVDANDPDDAMQVGLWVARELVAVMGGTLGASSAVPQGATLVIELPLP